MELGAVKAAWDVVSATAIYTESRSKRFWNDMAMPNSSYSSSNNSSNKKRDLSQLILPHSRP